MWLCGYNYREGVNFKEHKKALLKQGGREVTKIKTNVIQRFDQKPNEGHRSRIFEATFFPCKRPLSIE